MTKTLIASADRQALTSVLQGHIGRRMAAAGVSDEPFRTKQVIDDHAEMTDVLKNVLAEDKGEGDSKYFSDVTLD